MTTSTTTPCACGRDTPRMVPFLTDLHGRGGVVAHRPPADGPCLVCRNGGGWEPLPVEQPHPTPKIAVHVSTRPYVASHLREPRGRGSWAFAFGNPDAAPWFTPGGMTYSEARKLAVTVARSRGVATAYALP